MKKEEREVKEREKNQDRESKRKRKRKVMIAILLAIIIIILGLFLYHGPPEGTSEGTLVKVVLDEDNNTVCGAVVKLATDDCGNTVIATKTTNSEGKAYFYNLDYGTYYVNVSYTHDGHTFYGKGDPWEIVIIDDDLIEVKNWLRGYPEKVLIGGIVLSIYTLVL